MLRVPKAATSSVSSGLVRYHTGLAMPAAWRTKSTGSSTISGRMTSCSRNLTEGKDRMSSGPYAFEIRQS